jgi:hypothetical protein
MLRDLSYTELREWERFSEIEPLGGDRGDVQAAAVAACASWSKKRPTVYSLFPWWSDRKPIQPRKQMKAQWAAAVAGFNRVKETQQKEES